MINRLLILVLMTGALMCPTALWAQKDSVRVDYYAPDTVLKFAEYLFHQGDYLRAAGEYQRYLFGCPSGVDSTLYKIGLSFRLGGQIEKAIPFFKKITSHNPQSQFLSSAHFQIGYSYFLLGEYQNSLSYLETSSKHLEEGRDLGKLQNLIGLNYLRQKRWDEASRLFGSLTASNPHNEPCEFASKLKKYADEGKSLPFKSPWLAAILSTLLPGAGKVYCHRFWDGLYSFLVIGSAGWMAYTGFEEHGTQSVRGWIFSTLGGGFYLGNIYGSAIAARLHNQRLEDELLTKIQLEIDLQKF